MPTRPTPLTSAFVAGHLGYLAEPALHTELVRIGALYRFKAGEVLQEPGQAVRMLPLITAGRIKVSRVDAEGRHLFLYYLESGESCTMTFSCCMAERTSEIQAVVEEDAEIVGLPPGLSDEWIGRYPSWRRFVLRSYDERLRELVTTVNDVAFAQLDERLVAYLRKRAELTADGVVRASHQEIAADLNATRESTSRLLKTLERRGVVRLERQRVTVVE